MVGRPGEAGGEAEPPGEDDDPDDVAPDDVAPDVGEPEAAEPVGAAEATCSICFRIASLVRSPRTAAETPAAVGGSGQTTPQLTQNWIA